MSKFRRPAGVVVLAAAAVLTLQVGAVAQDVSIEIPLDTVIRAAEGSEHHLASAPVPEEIRGRECDVVARVENQRSVHPGNDLVITSGGDTLVLSDVEGESFGSVAGEGDLTLGSQVDVFLILGSDGVFSAGLSIEIMCPEPPATTTTSVPDTSTSVPETTTTVPPTMPEISTTSTTPTTVLGTSTSTTTGPDPTSTSTTVGPTSTSEPPSTLPFTGNGPDAPTLAAVASILFGLGLLVVTSSYETSEDRSQVDRR